jgi:hypothetical protein
MSRSSLVFVLLAAACNPDKGDTGVAPEGPHALSFDGYPSCAASRVSSGGFPDALTFEVWVRAEPGLEYEPHPLLVWQGAAALFQSADGLLMFGADRVDALGASAPVDVMDEQLHHVAGTWDGTEAALYVDGVRSGFNRDVTMGDTPSSTLYVGCWPSEYSYHQGVLDDVRVSSTVRYDDDFDLSYAPFEDDDDTLYLWHADEGWGDKTGEAGGGADLDLEEVSWVPFDLAAQ